MLRATQLFLSKLSPLPLRLCRSLSPCPAWNFHPSLHPSLCSPVYSVFIFLAVSFIALFAPSLLSVCAPTPCAVHSPLPHPGLGCCHRRTALRIAIVLHLVINSTPSQASPTQSLLHAHSTAPSPAYTTSIACPSPANRDLVHSFVTSATRSCVGDVTTPCKVSSRSACGAIGVLLGGHVTLLLF